MPNWNYHIAFSFAVYIILAFVFNISLVGGLIGFIVLGFASLLPDFDHPKSLIRQITAIAAGFGSFIIALKALVNYTQLSLLGGIFISVIIGGAVYFTVTKIRLKHRGKKSMHQIWVLIFVTAASALIFWLINLQIYFAGLVFLGYSSHLFLDWAKKQVR
ncbi:MAG TPA: metal-dependent hydrolase [archaeon]|nr:metal-dependent hydrolase [archaeon]